MAKLEHTLNYVNLWLEGIGWQPDCTDVESNTKTALTEVTQ